MKVPIRNLYYILCFAWKALPERIAFDLASLDACEDVTNLCAYVLASGIDHLVRRGLDRSYLLTQEQTSRLRGRVLITKTVKHRNLSSPTAICEFDEFSPNVPHNQILRSTVGDLLRSRELSADTRKRLEISFRQLAGIDTIPITNDLFRRVQLHRNNRHYAFLLFASQLLHLLKLPGKDEHGHSHFNDLLDDEKTMERVFEEFLRNFYKFKQIEFSDVSAAHLDWNARSLDGDDLALLPQMKTDIRLRSEIRTIVADAKYYKDALQEFLGTKKVHSENLYQLLAYLRAEHSARPLICPEGMLIYPVGDSKVDASFRIEGYPIRLFTLNLAKKWQEIESDLLDLISPITTQLKSM